MKSVGVKRPRTGRALLPRRGTLRDTMDARAFLSNPERRVFYHFMTADQGVKAKAETPQRNAPQCRFCHAKTRGRRASIRRGV